MNPCSLEEKGKTQNQTQNWSLNSAPKGKAPADLFMELLFSLSLFFFLTF